MTCRTIAAGAYASAAVLSLALPGVASAQSAPPPSEPPTASEEEVVVLSPFEVTASESTGYVATTTLAGSRINTQLKDVGSAVSVITSEFMRDTGATDNKTLLQYATATEVGSIGGNFIRASSSNQQEETTFTTPNTNTRVRGLSAADNTRNFFMSEIPWDAYNVDRVDMQRGPNSILFGMGSPAGIINSTTKTAQFRNMGEAEVRLGSNGTNRASLDLNQQLIANELAVRVALLRNDERYKQKPAYSLDKRLFATARWEPKFIGNESNKTTIKLNYETGRVRSNNPRAITPLDYITPWYTNLNRATYDPRTVQDNNAHFNPDQSTYYPDNYGEVLPTHAGDGTPNPYFQPWLGAFAQNFGGPLANYNAGNPVLQSLELAEFSNINGIGSDGAIDHGIGGLPYSRRVTVDSYSAVMSQTNAPYSAFGLYRNNTLTDSSIFDFYNNLLDGGNKKEWQNFNNFSASLTQTFLKQKLGFEIAYDTQNYDNGPLSLMTDQRAGIYVDMNANGLDGAPNPNVGKAFISDSAQFGNNSTDVVREAAHLSVFFDHDFDAKRKGNWALKLLGRHTLSGIYSQDSYQRDQRSFMRWAPDRDYAELVATNPQALPMTSNLNQINPVIYLTEGSLAGRTSAAGANIPRAGDAIVMPGVANMRYFDSSWTATGVDPAAAWTNPMNGQIITESENPANYVGWRTSSVNILQYENGDADALTTGASLQRTKSNSRSAVWQAHLWDDAIVGMYGIRNDIVKTWGKNASTWWMVNDPVTHTDQSVDLGRVNWATSNYRIDGAPTVFEQNSPSWSVVVKLDRLLGSRLPLEVNLFYNESQNFQVAGTRVDIYGAALPLPSGRTTDKGVMLATKDGRFSLKVNKFESTVKDASSTSGLNTWFLGGVVTWGSNYADVFTHHLGSVGDMSTANNDRSWHYTYTPDPGETQEAATARMNEDVAAWRALQRSLPAAYLSAWSISDFGTVQPHSYVAPAGFTATEDQVSKGYEFEFTANVTPNWRISANAAKITAARSNVGGAALQEFVTLMNDAIAGDAGDLRIWGGSTNAWVRKEWNERFYSQYALMRLLEGTASPELRKWRFNLVTSYDFTVGKLKGLTVGAGYRWQDKVAIGYRPLATDNPNVITYDLANPYMGPREDAIDLWVGYSRKLTSKIDWHVQLNVRNVGDGNRLIPLTTQPDGTPAAWRIAPSQSWTLTNTFKF